MANVLNSTQAMTERIAPGSCSTRSVRCYVIEGTASLPITRHIRRFIAALIGLTSGCAIAQVRSRSVVRLDGIL